MQNIGNSFSFARRPAAQALPTAARAWAGAPCSPPLCSAARPHGADADLGPILPRLHPDQTIVRWGTGAAADATTVAYRKKGGERGR